MLVKLCLLAVLGLALIAVAADPPAATAQGQGNPVVAVETSMGTFKIELFEDKAPITVKNFLGYVDDKFYDGVIFHRVMNGFMVQTGGILPGLKDKDSKKPPIKNEAANGLSNAKYTVAMARMTDPDTATSQFFVNVADNKEGLDYKTPNAQAADPRAKAGSAGYCVFGKVIEGLDVVDKIKTVRVRPVGGHNAVPFDDVTVKSIRRVEKKADKK